VPRLDAKTALITGASAGQGEAESRLFAAHNAHVVAADIDVDRAGRSPRSWVIVPSSFGLVSDRASRDDRGDPPLPWRVSAVASSRTAERHSSSRALPGQRREPLLHGHGDGRRWRRDRWTDGSAGPGVIRYVGAGLNACPAGWADL
jgi:hypothetical protein